MVPSKSYFNQLTGCSATLTIGCDEIDVIIASEPFVVNSETRVTVLRKDKSLQAIGLQFLKLNTDYFQ
jgi:hypothetical protein